MELSVPGPLVHSAGILPSEEQKHSIRTKSVICTYITPSGKHEPQRDDLIHSLRSSLGKCSSAFSFLATSPAPNRNNTNLDKSRFVLFFTRDYFGMQILR